jgi:ribosomal protein S18 acetylase RimI-like enzyme
VQQLAVPEAHRGQGLGTQLLHEAFGRFGARGRTSVGLATDSRTGALDLYLRTGMQVEREYLGHKLTLVD